MVAGIGLWLPVWFCMTFFGPKVDTLSIDEHGNTVWRRHQKSSEQLRLRIVLCDVLGFATFVLGHRGDVG
ncbi:hypothetical protein A5791_12025 [Mycobacterium sp. 852002-51163_SCH5372311]|uniref:hypothetical protein n=1 Tax=Mycobacterium sp. 852002-51163_SCH5372311 TaxID=1834097 RepID=UPI0007FC0DB2|nr:hypothetical protein [Mycobacterium sp. 852002-51163_SCH5372311]OBF78861.1 hypothetical protein A5791_12025 [Mycobacterium sp. 852002-51163_SCH5372311]